MPIKNEAQVEQVSIDAITVDRSSRQREKPKNIEELAESIKNLGLLHPIILTRDHVLVAGERRLMACTSLRWKTIPARYLDTFTPLELQAIELEENVKRSDLTWQEIAAAVYKYHCSRVESDSTWTYNDTAEELNSPTSFVQFNHNIGAYVVQQDEQIITATSLNAAKNILDRRLQRQKDTELSLIHEAIIQPDIIETDPPLEVLSPEGKSFAPPLPPVTFTIENKSFLEWIKTYTGPKFNFIHCDFPYGLNMQDSAQGRAKEWENYEDSPDLYFQLLDSFIENLDVFALNSCHIFFWYSPKFHTETLERFRRRSDLTTDGFPLIWHKSDNKGILPDPKRGPRRIYETALIFSRNDRYIIRPTSNLFSYPKGSAHMSEKPATMLEYFFQMYVDGTTSILDPTCGSGAAIIAGRNRGASRGLGLEIDPETAEASRSRLLRSDFSELNLIGDSNAA